MLGAEINEELFIPKIEEGIYRVEDEKARALDLGKTLPTRCKIAGLCELDNKSGLVLGTQATTASGTSMNCTTSKMILRK